MKIIQIGASSKKAGKTTLADYLVRQLKAEFALKISSGGHHPEIDPITSNPDIISKSGTDTGRLVKAGAKQVIWVSAGQDDLERYINEALSMFGEDGILIVEGNSGSRYISADLTVFIMNSPTRMFKESAHLAMTHADIILADLADKLTTREKEELLEDIRKSAPNALIIKFTETEWDTAFRKVSEIIRNKLNCQC